VGLAIVSFIVLVIMGAVAGLVLGRVFGAAVGQNENRPGAGAQAAGGSASDGGYHTSPEEGRRLAGLIFGGGTAAAGIVTALIGLVTALWESTFPNTVVLTSMGMVMGLVGYALGARTLGKVAAGLSAAALVIGLAFSQGYMPGLEPSDHELPAQEPRAGQ
jgi:hypothetical protein